jgi:hypothetical protein
MLYSQMWGMPVQSLVVNVKIIFTYCSDDDGVYVGVLWCFGHSFTKQVRALLQAGLCVGGCKYVWLHLAQRERQIKSEKSQEKKR